MIAEIDLQGAALYVPAVHPKLGAVLSGKVPSLRVAVVDLEDSVSTWQVAESMKIVRRLSINCETFAPKVYVRPRTPEQLSELVQSEGDLRWCGYVLPKLKASNVERWLRPLTGTSARLMPILETADAFCPTALRDICDAFTKGPAFRRIDAVRLGGTDLFSLLGARRPRGKTIYESVLGPTICGIACQLMARGLPVTAPVCEVIHPDQAMQAEVQRDVEAGFIGKTAISPAQVALINAEFAVCGRELIEARAILCSEKAVFQSRGAMCESSPHASWARRIEQRHAAFGLKTHHGDYVTDQVSP